MKSYFDPREQPVTTKSIEAAKAAAQAERDASGLPIDAAGRILLPTGFVVALELTAIRKLCAEALARTRALAPRYPEAAPFFDGTSARLADVVADFDELYDEEEEAS
jgi:hypothetical protein